MHGKITASWTAGVLLMVAGAAMAQTATSPSEQNYPTKPIRIIVGSSARRLVGGRRYDGTAHGAVHDGGARAS